MSEFGLALENERAERLAASWLEAWVRHEEPTWELEAALARNDRRRKKYERRLRKDAKRASQRWERRNHPERAPD